MEGVRMIGVIVGLVVGGLILIGTLILVLIYWLATQDVFFTLVREAEAKAVMKGDSFCKFVTSHAGYHFEKSGTNREKWRVEGGDGEPNFLEKWLGIDWIGIPPFYKIYQYTQSWASRVPETRDGRTVFVSKQEKKDLDSIFLRDDVYVNTVANTETKERIPLNTTYIMRARSVNPYLSLFGVQHWLEAAHGLIDQTVRDYIGTRTFEELVSQEARAKSGVKEGLWNWLTGSGIIDTLETEYGIRISSVDITEIDPAGELAKNFVEASTREYVATQERRRKEIEAEGEATAITKVADAINGGGAAGVLAVQSRTMTDLSKGTAATVVIPSNIADIFGQFGQLVANGRGATTPPLAPTPTAPVANTDTGGKKKRHRSRRRKNPGTNAGKGGK